MACRYSRCTARDAHHLLTQISLAPKVALAVPTVPSGLDRVDARRAGAARTLHCGKCCMESYVKWAGELRVAWYFSGLCWGVLLLKKPEILLESYAGRIAP